MSDVNDIVAVGLDLNPKTILHAYQNGIFPWPTPGLPLLWYCPQRRGVLLFDELHYSKRLKQYLSRASWTYTTNRAFTAVIDACAEPRIDETGEPAGTWITDEIKAAYIELHQLGHAQSVEVWNEGKLIGGLYGIDTAGYFAGESMFHRESNASKAALLFAIALQKQSGREWMDTQVITPHMEHLGAKEISRDRFLKMLATAKQAQKIAQKVGGGLNPFSSKEEVLYSHFEKFIT